MTEICFVSPQDCKLRENSTPDGEVTFNFEQKWFSNLLSYRLSEKSYHLLQ